MLLRGFSDRGEFVGVFIDEVVKFIDLIYDNIDLSFVDKILYLNHRMIQYIYKATVIIICHFYPVLCDLTVFCSEQASYMLAY